MLFMTKKFSLGLIFTILSSLFIIKPNLELTLINTSTIGPYAEGVNASFTTTLDVRTSQPHVYDFRFKYDCDGHYMTYFRNRLDVYGSHKYSFEVPFPTELITPDMELKMRMDVTDYNSGKLISAVNFVYQNKKSTKVMINDLVDKKYQSNYKSLHINQSQPVYHQDVYDFTKLNSLLFENHYHSINLDVLKFSSNNQMNYGSCQLSFYDRNNVFPYLRKIRSYTVIKLDIKKLNFTDYGFVVKDAFYVNPKTLEMSYLRKDGFQLTDRFYLPHNKSELLDNTTFHIYLNDMGIMENDYQFDTTYSFNHKLIGSCQNSDFCIVGEKS